MKYMALAMVLLTAVCYVLTGPAKTAPIKPSEALVSWQLDIDVKAPRPIMLNVPGKDRPQLFWYMLYTVTNPTNEEQMFIPNFVMYTQTGEIIQAGHNVPTAAVATIRKLHNNPLLKDLSAITGTILRGEDNAKDGVAIWPDFDPTSGQVDIFIGGLSGEVASINLPEGMTIETTEPDGFGKQQTVKKSQILLAKTLHLSYAITGDAPSRMKTAAKLLTKEWVMR